MITDSRMPNIILKRVIELSIFNYRIIDQEIRCGDSRIDFLLEREDERYITEVKGYTLCREGTALFPDAPTSRGSRQLKRMLEFQSARPLLIFVVLRPDAQFLRPNVETDSEFCKNLKLGIRDGLSTMAFKASLEKEHLISYVGEIPVIID